MPQTGRADQPFVITVTFELDPAASSRFLDLVCANAAASLRDESGCRRFDVLVPQGEGVASTVLLYDFYDDAAAFQAHLDSRHFKAFDEETRAMVRAKTVVQYALHGGA